jgi:molybdopterin converting factor small subunit
MDQSSIKITLRYYAILREQRGLAEEIFVTTHTTPRMIYQDLSARYSFTLPVDRIGVAVGDAFADLDRPLVDGDTVIFIPPVAGG